MANVYFELTREFNAGDAIAAVASGQAVVYYRVAIMSKDGDWVLKETPEACERVLSVLASKRAFYRPGAPLDVRWLAGGWSSHFEFADERNRRIRCDFFTRPPRVSADALAPLFAGASAHQMLVIDLESLIRMKQTQRAKDYPTLGELSRQLPPELELELSTDPDRIIELAHELGAESNRPPVVAARAGKSREEIVTALAREVDRMQQADRKRLLEYQTASREYILEFRRLGLGEQPLLEAHEGICALAEAKLPKTVGGDRNATPE